MRRLYILIFIFLIHYVPNHAQSTSSPYSMFAEGQVENYGSGTNRALGGTGIAFKSDNYLNNMNPASYSGIDSLSFIFELGMFGKYTKYITKNESETKFDANLSYLALGFRICKWWATSLGVASYSSVGYKINSSHTVEGDLSIYQKTFEGSGGITQLYFGNSVRPFKNLSLGINISYFLGSITHTETGGTTDDYVAYTIIKNIKIHSVYFDYGAQYTIEYNKWKYTLGAIFGNSKELDMTSNMYISNADNTLELETEDSKFIIPSKYGFGLAVEKGYRFKAGFDYERRNWEEIKEYSSSLLRTRDSERFSIGIEYFPYKKRSDRGLKKVRYRLGASYTRKYLIIKNEGVNSKTINFGFGIPIKRERSMINIAFELGSLGTTKSGLIKENYGVLHLNFTMHDLWFQKHKLD